VKRKPGTKVPIWALPIAIILLAPKARAQQDFEGLAITSVTYQPPATALDPVDLAQLEIFKVGSPFHAADAATVIDRLYSTGRFKDVQIDANHEGKGVAIRILTQNNWFVGHIAVEGKVTRPPSREELTNATRLRLGTPFREEDIATAERNLHRLLERNGLYEHSIKVETEDRADIQQRDVKFTIHMGPRAKYEMPVIGGDTKLPDETIVRATGWKLRFVGWWRKVTQDRTRAGINGILKKYQQQRRLTAKVEAQPPEYHPATRRLQPKLNIQAGPRVSVQAVETKVSNRVLKRYVPVFQEQTVDRDLLVEGARNLRDYFSRRATTRRKSIFGYANRTPITPSSSTRLFAAPGTKS